MALEGEQLGFLEKTLKLIEKYLLTSFQSFLPIPIAKNLCEATVSTPERKVNIETKPATTLYSP